MHGNSACRRTAGRGTGRRGINLHPVGGGSGRIDHISRGRPCAQGRRTRAELVGRRRAERAAGGGKGYGAVRADGRSGGRQRSRRSGGGMHGYSGGIGFAGRTARSTLYIYYIVCRSRRANGKGRGRLPRRTAQAVRSRIGSGSRQRSRLPGTDSGRTGGQRRDGRQGRRVARTAGSVGQAVNTTRVGVGIFRYCVAVVRGMGLYDERFRAVQGVVAGRFYGVGRAVARHAAPAKGLGIARKVHGYRHGYRGGKCAVRSLQPEAFVIAGFERHRAGVGGGQYVNARPQPVARISVALYALVIYQQPYFGTVVGVARRPGYFKFNSRGRGGIVCGNGRNGYGCLGEETRCS